MVEYSDVFEPGSTGEISFKDFLRANVPDITKIYLSPIEPTLSSIEQWYDWHSTVKSTLISRHLQNVIDWTKLERTFSRMA